MATDYTEIGNTLAAITNHLDLDRRFWLFHAEIDGQSLAVDRLDSVFDLESNAAQGMNAALRALIRGTAADQPGGQAATIQGMHTAIFTAVNAGFGSLLREELPVSNRDIAAGPITFIHLNTNGAITISEERGYLASLKQAMAEDGKQIKENAVTLQALTEFGNPTGFLDVPTAKTGEIYTLAGQLKLECTDDTVDAVTLSVLHELDDALIDLRKAIEGANPLTVGKIWQDGATGVTLNIPLGPAAIVLDGSSVFSALTITGAQENTTTKGKVFPLVTRQVGDVWLVELFSDAGFTNLVGSDATAVGAAGTTPLTIGLGALGLLAVTIDKGALAGAIAVGEKYGIDSDPGVHFDMKIPRVGDTWTINVLNDEAGQLATKLAKIPQFRIALPSGAVESAEFNDENSDDIVLP